MKANELLELINDEIVIDIMEENGSPVMGRGETSEGKPYLIFKTVCHQGNSSKLYYYSETKTFHCWTNCGTMSFYSCIMKIRGLEFRPCLSYIANKVGVSLYDKPKFGFGNNEEEVVSETVFDYNKIYQTRLGETKEEVKDIENIYHEEGLLNYFDCNTYYKGWIDEGISIDTMKKFKIGWYNWEGWITIPCFNINGELVGIRRRALDLEYEGQVLPPKDKYKPLEWYGKFFSFPTSKALYGIHVNAEIIKSLKWCVLFEGEKSVMKADSYYGNYPALAIYGSSVSEWQMQMLKKLGVAKVYLALDKDYNYANESMYKDTDEWAGYKFSKNKRDSIIKKLSNHFEVMVVGDIKNKLDKKDSPIDKGKETFGFLMDKASPSKIFLKE